MTLSSPKKNAKPVSFWFIGVHVSSSVRKLEAALIGTSSLEPNASITLEKSVSFDLPPEISDAFDELQAEIKKTQAQVASGSDSSQNASVLRLIAFLRAAISSIEEEAVEETLSDVDVDRKGVVAVVVNDPILMINDPNDPEAPLVRLSLGNPAELAFKTGLNVVDSLLAPPNAPKGSLKNSLAFPYWILLGGGERDKLLLDLGETARFTWLPSLTNDASSWQKIASKSIVPCGSLLNVLTFQTTKGASNVDVGGKLSVQGRCSNELLELWNDVATETNANASFDASLYLSAIRTANLQASNIDALCTAAHFVANQIYETIQRDVASFSDTFDLIVVGGAKQNGLLFSKLSSLFKSRPYRSLAEYGYLEDSFDAAAVATLGALFVSDIPVASCDDHKTLDKSQLGLVAPGNAENWKRFCRLCAGNF